MSTIAKAFVAQLNAADTNVFYSVDGVACDQVVITAFDLLDREAVEVRVSFEDIMTDPAYAVTSVVAEVNEKLQKKPLDSFGRLG